MNTRNLLIIIAILVAGGIIVYMIYAYRPHRSDAQDPVTCGAKTVFRYKYPEEMFPVITRDYTSTIKITTDLLGHLAGDSTGTVTVGADVRNTARNLRDTLSQDNIFFESMLRGYFFASNSDPCNDELRKNYTDFIADMTGKVIQMRQFISNVTARPTAADVEGRTGKDSIIAVVDTAAKKVDTSGKKIESTNLILVKNEEKISNAFSNIKLNNLITPNKESYRPVKFK